MAKNKTTKKTKVWVYSPPHRGQISGFTNGLPPKDVSYDEAVKKDWINLLNSSPYHKLKEV